MEKFSVKVSSAFHKSSSAMYTWAYEEYEYMWVVYYNLYRFSAIDSYPSSDATTLRRRDLTIWTRCVKQLEQPPGVFHAALIFVVKEEDNTQYISTYCTLCQLLTTALSATQQFIGESTEYVHQWLLWCIHWTNENQHHQKTWLKWYSCMLQLLKCFSCQTLITKEEKKSKTSLG